MSENTPYNVKIYGCIHKEIQINKQKITIREISKKAGIDDTTSYTINKEVKNPDSEITVYDGIELKCETLGDGS